VVLVSIGILTGASWLLRPVEFRLARSAGGSAPRGEQLVALGGRTGVLAVMGGLRSLAASACWLRANLAWEQGDAIRTCALINLTVAADERPLYFWLNGARIIACDLPEWQLAGAPAAVRQRVIAEHAEWALAFLAKGLRWHGPDAALYVEMANLRLRRLGDLAGAARCYRLAAEQPGAPYYAARIHGELLCALGRRAEALHWLRQVAATLPAGDPAARREVVLQRIHALEQE
jgi:hypothetical protein